MESCHVHLYLSRQISQGYLLRQSSSFVQSSVLPNFPKLCTLSSSPSFLCNSPRFYPSAVAIHLSWAIFSSHITYPSLCMMKWPLSHMQVMMQIENFGAILPLPSFFLTINLNNHILEEPQSKQVACTKNKEFNL